MKDLYLKFSDAREMKSALKKVGFKEAEEEPKDFNHDDMSLDIVGVIYKPESKDGQDAEYVAIPGYHVNLRVTNGELDLTSLEKFIVTPATPARVWA